MTAKDKPDIKLEHVTTSFDTVTGNPSAVWHADDEAGSKIGYAYFPDGSLKEMTYPGGKKQSWTYDNQGRTASFTDTAGVTTTYTHTDLGQIHTAKTSTGDNVEYGYDTLGRLDKTTRGNGITTTVEWDDRNQPAVITHTDKDGGLVSKSSHAYDIRGNLTKTVTETPAKSGGGTETAESVYVYDTADRLTSSTTTSADGTVTETAYKLNAASDITEETRTVTKPGGTAEKTVITREHDADGRLIKQTTRTPDGKTSEAVQEFDTNGNLLKDTAGNTFTYTPTGHLAGTTSPDGTTTGHSYWPTGLRKTTTNSAGGGQGGEKSESTAYWTPQAPGASVPETAVEETPDGTRASHLLAATRETRTLLTPEGKPTASEGAETGYLLHDRLGSTTHLTGADGTITTGYTYTDYGTTTRTPADSGNNDGAGASSPAGINRNPYTYTGATTDEATGHHYLRNRTYNPTTTHFTTRDTANLLNRYTYSFANPLKYTDQTGNTPSPIDWIDFGLNVAVGLLGIAMAIPSAGASLAFAATTAVIGIASQAVLIADSYEQWMPQSARMGIAIGSAVATAAGGAAGGVTTGRFVDFMRDMRSLSRPLGKDPALAGPIGIREGLKYFAGTPRVEEWGTRDRLVRGTAAEGVEAQVPAGSGLNGAQIIRENLVTIQISSPRDIALFNQARRYNAYAAEFQYYASNWQGPVPISAIRRASNIAQKFTLRVHEQMEKLMRTHRKAIMDMAAEHREQQGDRALDSTEDLE